MIKVPLFKVFMSDKVDKPLLEVLHSGYIGQGPKVEEFEKIISTRVNNPYVLTTSAGTHALHLALIDAGVKPGSTVLTTALTCFATSSAILYTGAHIRWCDISKDTLNIDPKSVQEKMDEDVSAIVCMSWGGMPADLLELRKIADKYGIKLIEDSAQGIGSSYKDSVTGDCKYTHYSMVSLQAIKTVTAVDGGILFCDNKKSYEKNKLRRWFGISREGLQRDLRCLHGKTTILTKNYKRRRTINSIVKNKLEGPILVLENGKFIERKIIGWHMNKLGNRFYVRIRTNSNNYQTIVTNDHLILTKNGYTKAENLKTGDLIASPYTQPTQIQKEILIGSLLGDGTVSKNINHGGRGVFTESHTTKQREYIELKYKSLIGLGSRLLELPIDKSHPHGSIQLHTQSLPVLSEYRNIFYLNKKKIIPKTLIEKEFSNLILAIWMMDDGSTKVENHIDRLWCRCQIALCGYTDDEAQWILSFFQKRGYGCTIGNHSHHSGWRIFFDKYGSEKLVCDIAPYVPPTMRYKVGHSSIVQNFNPSLWGDGTSDLYFDTVTIDYPKDEYLNKYTTVYCLTFEGNSHNFATTNAIVHNCESPIFTLGYKYHMSDVNAVIGMVNFEELDNLLQKASENVNYYREQLNNMDGITLLQNDSDRKSTNWVFTILVENQVGFARWMGECGIHVSRVHERNDIHPVVEQYKSLLPNLDYVVPRMVCLPCGWWVTESDRQYIIDNIRKGW